MKNIILILLFSFFTQYLVAQEIKVDGSIVTLNGDTLRGRIVVQDTYTQVEFEQVNTKGFKVYGVEDLKIFSLQDHKTFAPQEIPEDSVTRKVFGEMLVWEDPMKLFKFGNAFYLKKESKVYLLDKKESKYDNTKDPTYSGSQIHVIVNKRYVGILNYLMLDCSDNNLKKFINGSRLEDQSLIKVVQMYNQCFSPTHVEAQKMKRKSFSELVFRAGLMSSKAKVFNPYKPGGTYIPGYGLDFESGGAFYAGAYTNLQLSQHFSFTPELNFLRRKSSAPFEGSSTIQFDLTYLQIGLPVQYNLYLPNSGIISIYGGAGFQILLSNKSGIDNPPPKYAEYADIYASSSELSGFFGVRSMFKVGENSSFGFDIRYEAAFRHVINIKVYNLYSFSIGPILKINIAK